MKKHIRTRDRLAASAFRDAMRHILAEEGMFTLADHKDPRRFWVWNGIDWREELLPVPSVGVQAASAESTASPSSARR